jgi:hypothetical protein
MVYIGIVITKGPEMRWERADRVPSSFFDSTHPSSVLNLNAFVLNGFFSP